MNFHRLALSVLATGAIVGCSGSTEPKAGAQIAESVDVGPTMTISGTGGLSSLGGISSAATANPLSVVAAATGGLPAPPVCTGMPGGRTQCSSTLNGLSVTFTFISADSGGIRYESTLTGTIPARGGAPARRITRNAVSTSTRPSAPGTTVWNTRNVSSETGTSETLTAPSTTTADTGSTDIRMSFFVVAPRPADPLSLIPRMVGTSRRVVWTKVGAAAPTYWRETTTYDSSTVVRTRFETAAGVKNCSIDLAVTPFKTTCN
jgi:hypothetical protein